MTFSFRWGVELFDNKRTEIPNMIFAHYHQVPWTDKEGNQGVGISNNELVFILHLASFRFERKGARADPSLKTIAIRMGYKTKRSAINIVESLESKELLIVHRSNGKESEYDFSPFSKAIISAAMQDDSQNDPEKPEETGVPQYTTPKKTSVSQYTGQDQPVYHSTPAPNKRPMYKNTPVSKTGVSQYTGSSPTGVSQYTRINTTTKGDFKISEFEEIFKIYETNIGSITPLLADDIADTYRDLTPPEGETKLQWFRHAVKTAVENNVLKWKYARAVLAGIQRVGSLAADQGESALSPEQSLTSAPMSAPPQGTVDEGLELLRQVKSLLRGQMTRATYDRCVANTLINIEQQNGTVRFVVNAAPTTLDWIKNRLRPIFERAAKSYIPSVQNVEFVTETAVAEEITGVQPALI